MGSHLRTTARPYPRGRGTGALEACGEPYRHRPVLRGLLPAPVSGAPRIRGACDSKRSGRGCWHPHESHARHLVALPVAGETGAERSSLRRPSASERSASIFLWFMLAVLYLAALWTLGLMTLRKGHSVLFWVGIVFPVLWIVGAVIAPTPAAVAGGTAGTVQ
jgi:hypothetical protein